MFSNYIIGTIALSAFGVNAFPRLQSEALESMTGPSKRSGDCPFAATAHKQEKRQSTFDPTAQNVSTTGTHAWVAPNLAAGDQRGPCPGLNALANHGYLPHNGVADITTIVQATNTGMRRDHCAIMLMGMGTFSLEYC